MFPNPLALGFRGPQSSEEVLKSITTAYPTANTGTTAGAVVQYESLDPLLYNAGIQAKHLRLLEWLKGNDSFVPAKSLAHQFARVNKTFDPLQSGATGATTPAQSIANQIARLQAQIKLLNAVGDFDFMLNAAGEILPLEGTGDKTPGELEKSLTAIQLASAMTMQFWFGNSNISSNEFDGFIQQIDSNGVADLNVIDMAGLPLSLDKIEDADSHVSERTFSMNDTLFSSPRVISGLKRELQSSIGRYNLGSGSPVVVGAPIKSMTTAFDTEIKLLSDVFLAPEFVQVPTVAFGTTPPSTPGAETSIAAASHASSLFLSRDAGTYYYKIVAYSETAGYSLPLTTASVTVAAGERVTITMNDAAVSGVDYYHIWRSDKDGAASTAAYIGRFDKAAAGATAILDTNSRRPKTSYAVLWRGDRSHAAVAQSMGAFGPMGTAGGLGMQRVDFAVTTYNQRFGMVWQGVPYMPLVAKCVLFKNCANLPAASLA